MIRNDKLWDHVTEMFKKKKYDAVIGVLSNYKNTLVPVTFTCIGNSYQCLGQWSADWYERLLS